MAVSVASTRRRALSTASGAPARSRRIVPSAETSTSSSRISVVACGSATSSCPFAAPSATRRAIAGPTRAR
jgi:hypothetical protein